MKVRVSRIFFGGSADADEPEFALGEGLVDDGTVLVLFTEEVAPMMAAVAESLRNGNAIEWEVEDWQVLGVKELGAEPGE